MRHLILSHFGLAKPYRFERTLLALAALVLFVVLSVCGAWLWFRGGLSIGTPRWWYLIYVGALLLGVLCMARLPRIAAVFLGLATLEFGLGLGSIALYSLHIIPNETLAPTDSRRPTLQARWHPLLQAVWMPTRPEQPHDIFINSDGGRGPERSAEELRSKTVVALFGGSSTFDSQPDGQSWPDRLQAILGERYAVINRGMGGYTTAEHLIQTAFYERTKGVSPACAVYYVGWNDVHSSHVRDLDPGYAGFHLDNQIDGFRARRTDTYRSISPALTLLGRLAGLAFDTMRPTPAQGRPSKDPDPVLEEIFARNIDAISAINHRRGIRTIWVGQVMNRTFMVATNMSKWVPFVSDADAYVLIDRLVDILAKAAGKSGDVFLRLSPEELGSKAFYDQGHFSEWGARRFAELLAPTIKANCAR